SSQGYAAGLTHYPAAPVASSSEAQYPGPVDATGIGVASPTKVEKTPDPTIEAPALDSETRSEPEAAVPISVHDEVMPGVPQKTSPHLRYQWRMRPRWMFCQPGWSHRHALSRSPPAK
ncbi:hypothetical protein BGZ99_009464, partial [Dissophora globulifera]